MILVERDLFSPTHILGPSKRDLPECLSPLTREAFHLAIKARTQVDSKATEQSPFSLIRALAAAGLVHFLLLFLFSKILTSSSTQPPPIIEVIAARELNEDALNQRKNLVRQNLRRMPATPSQPPVHHQIPTITTPVVTLPTPPTSLDDPMQDALVEATEPWEEVDMWADEQLPISVFGLKTKPQRIVFLIDVSASMILRPRVPVDYRALENEVISALRKLPMSSEFNLIAFSADAWVFRPGFQRATPETVEAAIAWLRSYNPIRCVPKNQIPDMVDWLAPKNQRHEGTRADTALEIAFALTPRAILYVSDGEPTFASASEVLELVDALQQTQGMPLVTINTLAYLSDRGARFMELLAARNHGQFLKKLPE